MSGGANSRVNSRPWQSGPGVALAVFVTFAAGAVLSWESFGSWGGPSFFYLSAGITVAAMILNRRSLWLPIALAVIAAEVLVDTLYGTAAWVSAGFAAANVVEPLVGASLVLAWCRGRPDLRQRRDFASFVAGACIIAPLFGALIGGATSSLEDGTPLVSAVVTWWAGDALGILVLASPILLWPLQSAIVRRRPWEMAAVLVVTVVLSLGSFAVELPPSILILPVMAWAGFRLDMLGAAIAGVVAALLGNFMTTHGHGLFASTGKSQGAQVALTQIYVAVIVVVAMVIAQEAAARSHAVREREVERRERIRLETLSKLALQLSGALTPDDIGDALEEQVLNDAGASALSLGLISADGRRLEWITAAGYPPAMVDEVDGGTDLSESSLVNDVVLTGEPIEIRTAGEFSAAYPHRAHWLKVSDAESVVTWPLAAGGDPFGVLQMVWSEPQPLDTAQRAYISAVATMISQALVRAKIYADEHARAAVLHSVAQPVTTVDAVGLQYSALYRAAEAAYELGGDWYSVMALPRGRTYLSVGDVIGHGLMSVEDMAQLRITGNAYAYEGLSPAQILANLNRFASSQMRGEFASNFVATFDPHTQALSYSSAGHPPAVLRRAATGKVVLLSDAKGSLLGPFDDAVYTESTVSVAPGDVLVMYTDGLVEHHGEDLPTGISHLEQVVASWPPSALLDCEALAESVAPSPHSDDLCLLIVRFGPASDRS